MWLELLNVDSTALNKDPVRVIFKTGDDLRQDMITLRMFGLFENVRRIQKVTEYDRNFGIFNSCPPHACMHTHAVSKFK